MFAGGFGSLIARAAAAKAESARMRSLARELSDALARFRPATRGPEEIALVHTDGRGIIQRADPVAARLFNVPLKRLAGMMLIQFVARRDTGPFRALVKLLGYEQSVRRAEVHVRPRQGEPLLVGVLISRIAPATYCWSISIPEPAATAALTAQRLPRARPGAPAP